MPKKTILICEDDETTLIWVASLLEEAGYETISCPNGEETMQAVVRNGWPDLLILDIGLPNERGTTLCKRLRDLHPKHHIPTLLMTSETSLCAEKEAFEAGALDFLHKPFSKESLLARTKTHLELQAHREALECQIEEKTKHIVSLQNITIFALTTLCSERDQETGSHILRTQLYTKALAELLAPSYPRELTPEKIQIIFKYTPLHDIGKIGIPDRILLKPGKLTPEEFDVIKTHTTIGFKALETAESLAQVPLSEIEIAKKIIRSHHEKWNGTGYPDNLKGEEIPLESRIMAVADVYDAIRSRRVYKGPQTHEYARDAILKDRGTHFDPEATDAFMESEKLFESIAEEHDASAPELETARQRIKVFQED